MLHRGISNCVGLYVSYPPGRFEVFQKLSFGRGFVLGVELFSLPELSSEPILACGGDDGRVNLFVREEGKVLKAAIYFIQMLLAFWEYPNKHWKDKIN